MWSTWEREKVAKFGGLTKRTHPGETEQEKKTWCENPSMVAGLNAWMYCYVATTLISLDVHEHDRQTKIRNDPSKAAFEISFK